MKQKQVRYLPTVRLQIPLEYINKPEVLQLFNDAQRCGFTTVRYPADAGYCRVDLAVIGPEPKQVEDNLALLGSQSEVDFQQLTDEIKALTKQFRREDTAST